MTHFNLVKIYNALSELVKFRYKSGITSFKISLLIEKLEPYIKHYLLEENKLVEMYVKKENGQPVIKNNLFVFPDEESKKKYVEAKTELDNLVADISVDELIIKLGDIEWFGNGGVSPTTFLESKPFIKFEE